MNVFAFTAAAATPNAAADEIAEEQSSHQTASFAPNAVHCST